MCSQYHEKTSAAQCELNRRASCTMLQERSGDASFDANGKEIGFGCRLELFDGVVSIIIQQLSDSVCIWEIPDDGEKVRRFQLLIVVGHGCGGHTQTGENDATVVPSGGRVRRKTRAQERTQQREIECWTRTDDGPDARRD
jgi:hypothetical protein